MSGKSDNSPGVISELPIIPFIDQNKGVWNITIKNYRDDVEKDTIGSHSFIPGIDTTSSTENLIIGSTYYLSSKTDESKPDDTIYGNVSVLDYGMPGFLYHRKIDKKDSLFKFKLKNEIIGKDITNINNDITFPSIENIDSKALSKKLQKETLEHFNYLTNLHCNGLFVDPYINGSSDYNIFGDKTSIGNEITYEYPIHNNSMTGTWQSMTSNNASKGIYGGIAFPFIIYDELTG